MIDPKNKGSFPFDCTTPRPHPKHQEIVAVSMRCVNVRLRMSAVVVTNRRCEQLTQVVFNVAAPSPLRLLLSPLPASRFHIPFRKNGTARHRKLLRNRILPELLQ